MKKNKKDFRWLVLTCACLGMGMAMPSCPGQQETQLKIDALQASQTDLARKVQALTSQINALNNDMSQVKQLLPQMTSVITAVKTSSDAMAADLKLIKDAETARAAKPSGSKRRGR
jgi:septal ring factor EnvC (AmiA/AmiB activator)